MKTSIFLLRALLTLTIALSSISGAWALDWSGPYGFTSSQEIKDNITLKGNVTINVANGKTVTITGVISGGYGITINGGGIVCFKGNNTYTGKTILNNTGGYLELGGAGTTGAISNSSNVEISSGAGLVFNRSNQYTYSGNISGAGNVSKWNDGSELILSGSNTYAGKTAVWGKLTVSGVSNLSKTSEISLEKSSALIINNTTTTIFDRVISGAGALIIKGGGYTYLTATNTYTGTTSIENGLLYVGKDGTTGSIAKSSGIVLGSSMSMLSFYRSDAYSCDAIISGSGAVIQQGAGTTTLNKANTYTGNTYVVKGTLKLGASGTIASSAQVEINSNSIFDIGAHKTIKSLKSTYSTARVNVWGYVLTINETGTSTYAGTIVGQGGIKKTGSGTLTLTGTNTDQYGTTWIEGGTIEFSKAANFGDDLEFNGGTLKWASSNTADISSKISSIGSNGATFDIGNNVTFSKALPSGSGKITKAGSGTLIFTADNASTSTFTVSAGVLQLGNGGANGIVANNLSISSVATVSFYMNTNKTYSGTISGLGQIDNWGQNNSSITFTKAVNANKFRAAGASNSIFNTTVTPNIEILSNDASVTFNHNTYSGVISGNFSSAKVVQGGATLTLSGANTTTAQLVNNSGTMTLSNDWKGTYQQGANGRLVFGARTLTVAGLTLNGGTIDFTYPSSKLKITSSPTISGTTRLSIVSGLTGAVQDAILIEAPGGLNKPSNFTVSVSGLPTGYAPSLTCSATQVKLTVTAPTVPASSVTVEPSNLTLKVGGPNGNVSATVLPSTATDKSYSWSSSDESIAKVSSDGIVTPVKRGTCKIIATTTNGKTGECAVTVTQPVTSVNLSHTTIGLQVGGSQQLTASVSPADANNQDLNWTSSTTGVATVSSSGLVKAVAVGTATITATSVDDPTKKATCTVTVTSASVAVTGVTLSPSTLSLSVGETKSVTVSIQPSNATNANYTLTSSNNSVATVTSAGAVKAIGAGSCTITVTTAEGNFTSTCAVTVTAASSLSVTPTSLSFIAAGASQSFTVTSNVSWSASSSASWLTVSPTSGSNSGTVTVTAAANSSTSARSATVTVSGGGITRTVSVSQSGTTPSSNNNLASLSLNGVSMSPTFSPTTYNYTASVPNGTTSVGVTATAADGGATVSISGNTNLQVGPNTITITVTAANGSVRIYTIIVTRDVDTGNEALNTTHIYASGGTLYLALPAPETVQIYALTGRLVRTLAAPAGATNVSLPNGVYIIKTPSVTVKVVL